MPELWMPGVPRYDTGRRLTMRGQGSAKIFTWHTFEAPYSYSPDLRAATKFLAAKKSDPHFVFHPITGALVQMLPANTGGRTLLAPQHPTIQTNTYGSVHMQVEVIAYARNPWTDDLTDAGRETLGRLLNFLRSWGIPDQWCEGVSPSRYSGEKARFMPKPVSGHTGHSLWRTNDHWDPGGIVGPWTLVGSPSKPAPPDKPGWETPAHMKAVQSLLNNVTAAGLAVDGVRGPKTEAATLAYQTDYRDDLATDGSPGPQTRTALEEDMSAINELRDYVAERTTVVFSESTGRALSTGRLTRSLSDALNIIGNRVGRTDQRMYDVRAEVAGLREAVLQIGEVSGMDREQVEAIVVKTVNDAKVTMTADQSEEN